MFDSCVSVLGQIAAATALSVFKTHLALVGVRRLENGKKVGVVVADWLIQSSKSLNNNKNPWQF